MLGKVELERLRLQKDLLVLQSEANRWLLVKDWQRLHSPENWLQETGDLARRHPIWTAALAAAAGTLAIQAVRKPGNVMGGKGSLGKLATAAFSVWKLIRQKETEE
jgi:hypothetical protein